MKILFKYSPRLVNRGNGIMTLGLVVGFLCVLKDYKTAAIAFLSLALLGRLITWLYDRKGG